MPLHEPETALHMALERAALLGQWLEALKDEPLEPAHRPEDRLSGLGRLAVWLATEPVASAARDALEQGPPAVRACWTRWMERRQDGPWLRRITAVVLQGWGAGAEARGELTRARFWYEQSLSLWCGLAEAPTSVWALAWPEMTQHEAAMGLRLRVVERLTAYHGQQALESLERGDWPRAQLHWQTLSNTLEAIPQTTEQALVKRLVAHSRGMEGQGAERGGAGRDGALLALVEEGLALAPDALPLHQRRIDVATRAARVHYTLVDRERFVRAVTSMQPSLEWLLEHRSAWHEVEGLKDAGFREGLAEAWVCRAAVVDHPRDAVQALREAIFLSPHHPTARLLLGQALAALAARSLGAGRVEAAEAALAEANALLPPSAELARLTQAVRAEVVRRQAQALQAPVWDLDGVFDPPTVALSSSAMGDDLASDEGQPSDGGAHPPAEDEVRSPDAADGVSGEGQPCEGGEDEMEHAAGGKEG